MQNRKRGHFFSTLLLAPALSQTHTKMCALRGNQIIVRRTPRHYTCQMQFIEVWHGIFNQQQKCHNTKIDANKKIERIFTAEFKISTWYIWKYGIQTLNTNYNQKIAYMHGPIVTENTCAYKKVARRQNVQKNILRTCTLTTAVHTLVLWHINSTKSK